MSCSYTEHESAQAIVWWLRGMPQREIARRLGKRGGATAACLAISAFTRRYAHNLPDGLDDRRTGAPWNLAHIEWAYDRKKFAENALTSWCRSQPVKPRFRLAPSYVRLAQNRDAGVVR